MTTAAAKSKKAKTPDVDKSKEFESLSLALSSFGFTAPVALIEQWSTADRAEVIEAVDMWKGDFNLARQGVPLSSKRTAIPPLLKSLEGVSPLDARAAVKIAIEDCKAGRSKDNNPYPVGSAISTVWLTAFLDAKGAAPVDAKTEDVKTIVQPESSVAAKAKPNAEQAAAIEAERMESKKADQERQQQLAIEAAQAEMEEAASHQADLEEQLIDMKSEMKEVKAAFDNAGARVRKASRALARAREGIFERTLPFPKESGKSIEVPDQNVGSDGVARPAARDEGGFVSLDYLVKGDLQEFIPGTPEDRGLSEKQVEKLKSIVGETIADLEKFQQKKGQWWVKEIEGFGPETITKLQDAQEVIRRKFPIPSPDDATPDTDEAESDSAEPIPASDAIGRLGDLVAGCDDVIASVTHTEGVRFARSVKKQAESMATGLAAKDTATVDQVRAICNWEHGISKWLESNDEGITEDLDVPDVNGDDE